MKLQLPIEFRIDSQLYQMLYEHLFPGDQDEHAAIVIAGISQTTRGTRFLAREVVLARDGIDYVPGQYGYRALSPRFIAEMSGYCADENLCYFAVHCHGGADQVAFSAIDLASHERGYPALLDITNGGPIGALVFAQNAVAGDIWTASERYKLDHLTIVGTNIRRLYPSPRDRPQPADPMYDRHARLIGDIGQEILANCKAVVIGLGGGGSLISQELAHLGVGHIVAVDFDRVELTNRPRIVGSTPWDALEWFVRHKNSLLRRLGQHFARYKVHVAKRVAEQANPRIQYDAIVGSVVDEAVANLLRDADFLFLATDSIQSRLVFNALVHQFLIPGVQVGVKIHIDPSSHEIGDIVAVTRPVLPFANGGCLHCHELIPASHLQEEALTQEERRTQRYIEAEEVAEPSVITLNAASVSPATNLFFMMMNGLHSQGTKLRHQLNFVHERQILEVEPRANKDCFDCSDHHRSRRAKGDVDRLPCRVKTPE